MPRTVYKYPLPRFIPDRFAIDMPRGARPLHFAEQYGTLCVWALVDPSASVEPRQFRVAGTGHMIPDSDDGRYLGTVLTEQGALVLHLFDLGTARGAVIEPSGGAPYPPNDVTG